VEWAGEPLASLPARLQAADALCAVFSVHRDLHEQVGACWVGPAAGLHAPLE